MESYGARTHPALARLGVSTRTGPGVRSGPGPGPPTARSLPSLVGPESTARLLLLLRDRLIEVVRWRGQHWQRGHRLTSVCS